MGPYGPLDRHTYHAGFEESFYQEHLHSQDWEENAETQVLYLRAEAKESRQHPNQGVHQGQGHKGPLLNRANEAEFRPKN